MAGNSGYVDFTATNYSSTQTLRVYWQETVNATPGATSTVAITKVQLASESYVGDTYYADFVIQINGTTVIDCREGVTGYGATVYLSQFNTFTDVTRSGNQLTGSVSGIAHDSQGKKSIDITLAKNPNTGYSYGGFWRMGAHFSFTTSSTSKAITLLQIPVGTLSISAGTGSTITVNRTSSPSGSTGNLSNGAALYYNDKLKISFGVSTGYNLGTHTVNGSTFTSGNTHTVTGNVSVASTAALKTYTLSISAGTGSTITVKRGSTTLSNGATITHGDVLTITFGTGEGYNLGTHTVNGTAFTSGGSHTVTGAVSVVSSATVKSFTLSISAGTGSTITVNRTSSPKQGAATGNLANGAAVFYSDKLTITFGVSQAKYELATHTVNGATFTSGSSHTVGGAVSVAATAALRTYTLSISHDANSAVQVKRGSTTLSSGATITYGDVLTITFNANSGYAVDAHTVNESTFTSGNTHTVTGDVAVSVTSKKTVFTLTINKGANTNLTVKRGSTTLSNGAQLTYGDVLTVTYSATGDYSILKATLNNVSIANNSSHTVTSDVTVVTQATANPHTLSISAGTNVSIGVKRGQETLVNGSTVVQGDVLTITFTTAPGYILTSATINGTAVTDNPATYTVPSADVTILAYAGSSGSLAQPSNITPDVVNGTGCIDATEGLTVSWKVNGNAAMIAYKITIYQNNSASTQLYTTGKVNLSGGVWGHDYEGNVQFFTANKISASALSGAGITNGAEYKLLITQWWSESQSVEQTTASVFVTRSAPAVVVSHVGNVETTEFFEASYTQAQGSPLSWVRWQIYAGDTSGTPVYDSGIISGTGELRTNYSGMTPDETYLVVCSIETNDGVRAQGSLEFTMPLDDRRVFSGSVTACLTRIGPETEGAGVERPIAVLVSWPSQSFASAYAIHRMEQNIDGEQFRKITVVGGTETSVVDYGACGNTEYTYYVFPIGDDGTIYLPGISNPLSPAIFVWRIIEATRATKNSYVFDKMHIFRMGKGGVSEGELTNNNKPSIQKNFTRYPMRQTDSSNYYTGSVSGYIGTIVMRGPSYEYVDTVHRSEALRSLSQSGKTLFLLDPKGHMMMIATSGPITMRTDNTSRAMPITATIPWVEVGSADNITVTELPKFLLIKRSNAGVSLIRTTRVSSIYGGSTGNLPTGAVLYPGDVLTFTYTASSGYQIASATVNGTAIPSSGYSMTVSGSVDYVVLAEAVN